MLAWKAVDSFGHLYYVDDLARLPPALRAVARPLDLSTTGHVCSIDFLPARQAVCEPEATGAMFGLPNPAQLPLRELALCGVVFVVALLAARRSSVVLRLCARVAILGALAGALLCGYRAVGVNATRLTDQARAAVSAQRQAAEAAERVPELLRHPGSPR